MSAHREPVPAGFLTPSERALIIEIARGADERDAAARTGIPRGTAKKNLKRARRRLGAVSTAHLVAVAIRRGLLPVDVAEGSEVTR